MPLFFPTKSPLIISFFFLFINGRERGGDTSIHIQLTELRRRWKVEDDHPFFDFLPNFFFFKLVASRQLDLCPEQGLLSLRRKSFRFFFVRFLFILFHFPLQAHPRFSSSSSSSSSYTREARLALCGAHVDWVCTLEIGDRLMQSPAKGVYEVTREIGKALSFTLKRKTPPCSQSITSFSFVFIHRCWIIS